MNVRRLPIQHDYLNRDFAHQQHGPAGRFNWGKIAKIGIPTVLTVAVASTLLFRACAPKSENIIPNIPAPPAITAHGKILERAQDAFQDVLHAKGPIDAQFLFGRMDEAQRTLLATPAPPDVHATIQKRGRNGKKILVNATLHQHQIVVGRLDGKGGICDIQLISGIRPEPGASNPAGNSNASFTITRPSEQEDPGGIFGELRITPQHGAAAGTWVALGAKVYANSVRLGKKYYITAPYSSVLDCGQIAQGGLAYLLEVDANARAAIKKYGSNGTRKMLEKTPKNANVLIALIEHIGPENLADGAKFKKALARVLYHLAMQREQSWFITSSSAGACGPFQVMPNTEASLLKLYSNEPWEIFDAWSRETNYPPFKWLDRKNRIGDIMYTSIIAYFHHRDILEWLERKLGSSANSFLYSEDLQTMCAIASGYNGGPKDALELITSAGSANWHNTQFVKWSGSLQAIIDGIGTGRFENPGYVVKTQAVWNAMPGDTQSLLAAAPGTFNPSTRNNITPQQQAFREKARIQPVHTHRKGK